eukprot:6842267-Pyramimonas_sp.AAC.1
MAKCVQGSADGFRLRRFREKWRKGLNSPVAKCLIKGLWRPYAPIAAPAVVQKGRLCDPEVEVAVELRKRQRRCKPPPHPGSPPGQAPLEEKALGLDTDT